MGRFGFRSFAVTFAVFLGLVLNPGQLLAQHGGGHSGGGGGSHSGGGGSFHGGGGESYGGVRSYGGREGGGSRGSSAAPYGGRTMGGSRGSAPGMARRTGGLQAGRGFGSGVNHASNIHPAINDGQWHSFGSTNASARFGTGFGGGNSRTIPGFGWGGRGWGSGWGGGWGRGCCWGGWGFGFGGPYWGAYWGPAWGFGWNPWWYSPYWGYDSYWLGPPYAYYPDYSYDWSDNPPYRSDPSQDNGSKGKGKVAPTLNQQGTTSNNDNTDAKPDDGNSSQHGNTPEPALPSPALASHSLI